jgi:hypothetical protein
MKYSEDNEHDLPRYKLARPNKNKINNGAESRSDM